MNRGLILFEQILLSPRNLVSDQILINTRTFRGGNLEAGLVQKETPLPGFSAADCIPVKGDAKWEPVRWKGKPDLSELKGKRFVLHFRLTKAKLFGYRIPSTSFS